MNVIASEEKVHSMLLTEYWYVFKCHSWEYSATITQKLESVDLE